MRVIVFVKATPSSEAGQMPSERMFADMGRYNEALANAGILKDGAGLQPTAKAVRVRFSGDERTVINGPFAETKELVAGYWLWEVDSMEQAVAWVRKCPNPMPEPSEVEIRPFYEAADFGEALTPELRAQEDRVAAVAAMPRAQVQPYLFYNGRCEEALGFYASALQARVGMVLRWKDSPEPPPPGTLPAGFEDKIMHSEFTVGGTTILASDGCGGWTANFDGFRLALTVPDAVTADHAFNALADGGRIDMPLARTFWSPRYGMVTDRFGIGWMVMVPGQKP
jgi:PhnB protein